MKMRFLPFFSSLFSPWPFQQDFPGNEEKKKPILVCLSREQLEGGTARLGGVWRRAMAPIVLPSPGATAAVVCEDRDVERAVGSSGKEGRGCEPEEALRVLKSSLPRGGGPALVLWTRGYHTFGVAQSLYPKLGFRALGGAVLPPGWSVKGTEGGLAFDQGGADEQATTRGVVVLDT